MGRETFRVTGSIRGKQRKRQFLSLADAEVQRDAWEAERVSAAAAMRPKITRLTYAQIVEAEACLELLRGTGFTLSDAAKALLRNPPLPQCQLTFDAAYRQFLYERKPFLSPAQYCNYESPCRRLAEFLGLSTRLADVTTVGIAGWLTSLQASSKTWNNYRGDLSVICSWFAAPPRRWLSENPVVGISRFRKRDTLPGPIEVLPCSVVREMMHWLEREKPNWVTIFGLAVFAGIRPDREDGEMFKLAKAVKRGDSAGLFRGDSLYLSASMTKDGRPRRVPITENLRKWIELYPLTDETLHGGTRAEYAAIRKQWNIPHDGLRHTSISACTALHGISEAAARHGTSERIIKDHYLSLLSTSDASDFYTIQPAAMSR
jgi:hypothetical protein